MRQIVQKAFFSAVPIPASGDQNLLLPSELVPIPVGAKLKVYAASGTLSATNPQVLQGNGFAVIGQLFADQAGTINLANINLAVCPTSGFVGVSGLQAVSPLGGCLLDIDNTISVDAELVILGSPGGLPQAIKFSVFGDLHNTNAGGAEGWNAYWAALYELILVEVQPK